MVLRGIGEQMWDPTGMEKFPSWKAVKRKPDEPWTKASMQCLVPWTPQALAPTGQIEQLQNVSLRLPIIVTDPSILSQWAKCSSAPSPTSIHSPILKTIISSLLAMSLNQTLKTGDLGPKALASSEICVTLMYTQFEFHVLLVSHIPVCFSQEFRAGTQSHVKPLSTPIFTPQLTTLFLFYRVLFLTWPLIPKSSPTGRSSRWTWRMQYAVTRGPGMAVTVATTLKPVHRAHLPTHSRPFMWVTSLFPAGSQTCLRTPSSSFLDGPRYVSSWKVFAFRPQMSSFLCLIQHQKDC